MVSDKLCVEVAYAGQDRQAVLRVEVPAGCCVEKAIRLSKILEQFPEIDLASNAVGIFSRRVALTDPLTEGDRIEIYRPLVIDPKVARQRRAKKQKASR